jgi:short-subunit dehydrogenase
LLVARSGDILKDISDDIQQKYPTVKCLFIATDLVHHTVPYETWQKCEENKITVDYLVNNA